MMAAFGISQRPGTGKKLAQPRCLSPQDTALPPGPWRRPSQLLYTIAPKNISIFGQNDVFLKFLKILPHHVKKGRFATGGNPLKCVSKSCVRREKCVEYVLEMKDISKTFPGVVALDHVQLRVKPGEVHALMGENGAGKSTLMSILFGLYEATSGEIYVKGEKTKIANPNDANRLGIGMVH